VKCQRAGAVGVAGDDAREALREHEALQRFEIGLHAPRVHHETALKVREFKRAPYDYEGAFAELVQAKADAVLVLVSGLFVPARRLIPELALTSEPGEHTERVSVRRADTEEGKR